MKKYIIGFIIIFLAGAGFFIYNQHQRESKQSKDYPNIRMYLEDLLTDNKYGVYVNNKDGQDITDKFLDDYQEMYDKEGLNAVMDDFIDEFAKEGYTLRVDHPAEFKK